MFEAACEQPLLNRRPRAALASFPRGYIRVLRETFVAVVETGTGSSGTQPATLQFKDTNNRSGAQTGGRCRGRPVCPNSGARRAKRVAIISRVHQTPEYMLAGSIVQAAEPDPFAAMPKRRWESRVKAWREELRRSALVMVQQSSTRRCHSEPARRPVFIAFASRPATGGLYLSLTSPSGGEAPGHPWARLGPVDRAGPPWPVAQAESSIPVASGAPCAPWVLAWRMGDNRRQKRLGDVVLAWRILARAGRCWRLQSIELHPHAQSLHHVSLLRFSACGSGDDILLSLFAWLR